MTQEEKNAIAYLRFYLGDNKNEYFDKDFVVNKKDLQTILNLIQKQDTEINKLNNVINRIKNYTYQEVAHITEDIKDYIDDDKEGNKNIIGEFKETREQWKDIMRIIEGKADTDLYVNWKEWGEYE